MKRILITGTAGFIGHHLVKALAPTEGVEIVGVDSINDYYDVRLKHARLADTGIDPAALEPGVPAQSTLYPHYRFVQMDISCRELMSRLFEQEHFTHVCHLAGQAGVRYSIENPYSYVQSNVVGFLNILEGCRHQQVEHLVYASSSSVYGMADHVPFSETDNTDQPVSLYAATKKSDEVMAYAYSQMYGLRTTGLRLFTVYGPWGRPDMAPYKFMNAIINGDTIQVFNHGQMLRDFTYIGDVTEGIRRVLLADKDNGSAYAIYNIGCSSPVMLMDFIHIIERLTGHRAKMEMKGMQPGDVKQTYADSSLLMKDYGYCPVTSIEDGLKNFYDWFVDYHKNQNS